MKKREIVKGEVLDGDSVFEIKTTKGTWIVRKWLKKFGRKPQFPWEAVQVEGGTKVENARYKKDILEKIGPSLAKPPHLKRNPKKTKRKSTAKQLAARKLFAKRVRAGEFKKPFKKKKRKAVKKNALRKKSVKRKAAKRVARKRNPAPKYAVRGTKPVKSGYLYYFLRGRQFVKDIEHADTFTKASGEARMRQIVNELPGAISSITLVRI